MNYITEALMSITIGEALKELNSGGGTSMFIPSFGRKLLFRKVNTGIQKTIGRISLDSGDRYRSGLMRLALFDDLLLEGTREYRSSMLKTIDVIAFLCQLRMQTTDSVDIRFICPKCGSSTDVSISLKKVLENCGKHKFEEIDVSAEDKNTGRKYSFKICDPSYLDVAILTESIVSMKSSGTSVSELEFYYIYSKLCLYIDSMSIDGKEIKGDNDERFCKIPVVDRLKLFDSIDQEITIMESNPNSLVNVISSAFSEDVLSRELYDGALSVDVCSGSDCGALLGEVMSYDSFFTV